MSERADFTARISEILSSLVKAVGEYGEHTFNCRSALTKRFNCIETAFSRGYQIFNYDDSLTRQKMAFHLIIESMFFCFTAHVDEGKVELLSHQRSQSNATGGDSGYNFGVRVFRPDLAREVLAKRGSDVRIGQCFSVVAVNG